MSTDLSQNIQDGANAPRRVRSEAGAEAEQHPLPDLIKADEHLRRSKVAARGSNPFARLRIARISFGRDA